MNKIYDKLLLAIAALLLAGGGFLYMQKSGAAPEKGEAIDTTPANNPYQPEPVPNSTEQDVEWPEPLPQAAGQDWLYDVFTPPKIYIRNGAFDAEPPKDIVPPQPFGIYLADIRQKPYRIQLEGYIEEDLTDSSKSLLLLFNEETQKQVRARPGDEKADVEFKVISFEIARMQDENGGIAKVATGVILDQRTGEEITLVHGEKLFYEEVTVYVRSAEDPSFEFVTTSVDVPVDFEGPIGHYTLQEINLEESSVTVEKKGTEEFEPETRALVAKVASASSTPSDESIDTEASNAGLEDLAESFF